MKYQSDAHHYHKKMRKNQRMQQLRGAVLLVFSFAMLLYAIPGFAKSIWDEGLPDQHANPTIFSHTINDNSYENAEEAVAAEAEAEVASEAKAKTSSRVTSKVNPLVSETTGPGMLNDDEAVTAAKRRAEAVIAATNEKNSYIEAIQVANTQSDESSENITFAFIALALGLCSAVLGIRTILASRQMRGKAISAAYSSALRA